jgi:hypothetical protein
VLVTDAVGSDGLLLPRLTAGPPASETALLPAVADAHSMNTESVCLGSDLDPGCSTSCYSGVWLERSPSGNCATRAGK